MNPVAGITKNDSFFPVTRFSDQDLFNNVTGQRNTDEALISPQAADISKYYSSLFGADKEFSNLSYTYLRDELNFSLSLNNSLFKVDLQGNVSFMQETLNVKLSIEIEEFNASIVSGKNGKGRTEEMSFSHFKLNFDLERTSFEYLLKNGDSPGKTEDLITELLRELAKISLKDEKKLINLIFGNKEAVGAFAGKIGRKVLDLVMFMVIVSHLSSSDKKSLYSIWLYGGLGGEGKSEESILSSFEKIHFEIDIYVGGKIKSDNGKHKVWIKPGGG